MAAALSRRRASAADYTWPGYVDALTTLLMVLIFLLSIFSVAQFTLSNVLSTKDTAIDALGRQVNAIVEQLNLEKQNVARLQREAQALNLQIGQLRTERDSLRSERDGLKTDRDQLSVNLKALEARSMDLQKETERQKLELTRLAAALAAANEEKGKYFSDLSEEQKLAAEQKAAVVRMTAEMAALKEDKAIAYRAFSAIILPGLLRTTGKLVLPLNTGIVCNCAGKPKVADRFMIYGEQGRWELLPTLPVAAAGELMVLATGGAAETECHVATDGAGGGEVAFGMSFRQFWPDPVEMETRVLRYVPIPAKADPVVFVAKRLRRHVMEIGRAHV